MKNTRKNDIIYEVPSKHPLNNEMRNIIKEKINSLFKRKKKRQK